MRVIGQNISLTEFKPFFYRRYIDDTFLLVRDKSHVKYFHDYLNKQHPNIKFTYETEQSKKLSFLDITISRDSDSTFKTSFFRKPTFTKLGSSFFSFCPLKFKTTSIQKLIVRAFRICSTYSSLHIEFDFLRKFFFNYGYP